MYDIAIIGGGPGGYVAAIKAAQNGMRTVLFEMDQLGGVCLNKGCIPTKALLKSASIYHGMQHAARFGLRCGDIRVEWANVMGRKTNVVNQLVGGIDHLIKSNGIDFVAARATLKDSHTIFANGIDYSAKHIILATGSQPSLPPIQGINEPCVMTSDDLLNMHQLPKSIAIIGGGVIGLEFAFLLNRFGVQVKLIEMLPQILAIADATLILALTKDLKKSGIAIVADAKVERIETGAVVYEKDGAESRVQAEQVLVATGRKPFSDTSMLDQIGILHTNGVIRTDECMRTNVEGVYAIGDVNGTSMLAHTASEEGIVAVEHICGHAGKMDYRYIPQCVYLEPEIAWVGLTEQQARAAEHDVCIGLFPMCANGKSVIEAETTGMIKIISDSKHGEILGAHLYCAHATDMISGMALAIKEGCCIEDIARCVHPHPTVSEGIMEAANAANGMAVHILRRQV